MDESLKNFDQFCQTMCNAVNVAKAEKVVAEELKNAMKKKLEESATKMSALEVELQEARLKIKDMEQKLKKKNKKIRSISHNMEKAEEKILAAEKRALTTEEKVLIATKKIEQAVEEAVNGAVKEYIQSKAFDDKLHGAGVESYNHDLADCLRKVKKFYLDLDTSKIQEDSDEEDSDEEDSDKKDQVEEPIIDQTKKPVGDQTKGSTLDPQIPEETLLIPFVNQAKIEESSVGKYVTDQ